jgi:hypothetical protein
MADHEKTKKIAITNFRSCMLCNRLESEKLKLMLCSKCKFARYCSKECQKKDWKGEHKSQCKRIVQAHKEAPMKRIPISNQLTPDQDGQVLAVSIRDEERCYKFVLLVPDFAGLLVDIRKADYLVQMRHVFHNPLEIMRITKIQLQMLRSQQRLFVRCDIENDRALFGCYRLVRTDKISSEDLQELHDRKIIHTHAEDAGSGGGLLSRTTATSP